MTFRFFRRRSAVTAVEPEPEAHSVEDPAQAFADRRATDVQRRILGDLPAVPNLRIGLDYRACEAVGGDFVEVCPMPDGRVLIAIGDVAGHGAQGALLAVACLKTLRELLHHTDSLGQLVTGLNDQLQRELLQGQFVTTFIAILDPTDGRMIYACNGHPHVLLLDPDGPILVRRYSSPGMPLGLVPSDRLADSMHLTETTVPANATLVT